MEARKSPVEIAEGFAAAVDAGASAELVFVGGRSASDASINSRIRSLITKGYPIEWVESATDSQVARIVAQSDVFLSVGTEGYGIPVLEAIGLGTPVLFSGVQPAAELMVGSGSTEIEFGDPSSFFTKYSKPEEIIHLVSEIEKNKIPLWSDFSAEIERAVRKTVN